MAHSHFFLDDLIHDENAEAEVEQIDGRDFYTLKRKQPFEWNPTFIGEGMKKKTAV
jgi:hypothetical protein